MTPTVSHPPRSNSDPFDQAGVRPASRGRRQPGYPTMHFTPASRGGGREDTLERVDVVYTTVQQSSHVSSINF